MWGLRSRHQRVHNILSIVVFVKMHRFMDDADVNAYPSPKDYSARQHLSLEQALEPIIPRIDRLNEFIPIAKGRCHFPSEHNLTHDESAAIFLYTMEWDENIFYQTIQRDLRSNDASTAQSWWSYLTLFDTAVQKLPNRRLNVWRGVNEDVCKKLKKGDELIWPDITSCSSSENVIKDCLKLNCSLCSIEVLNGKDISIYSHSPNQNEIILCSNTRLQVVGDTQDQTSSPVLRLRECDRLIGSAPLRWKNNQAFSLLLHFIVPIAALLLVAVMGKTVATFESSYFTTLFTTSRHQAMQSMFPSGNKIDYTTIIDKPSTIHTYVDTLGNRYEGELVDGKKHGKGKMNFVNGHTYVGDWMDDMVSGEGVFTWTNGDRYEGQLKSGQRSGKGSYYFANGDMYIGDWLEDKKAGDGVSTLAVGKYEGQFHDDKIHGKGSFYFTDGSTYVGDWIENKQEGEGIFSWANGDRYEGGFKAGKLHGQGSYYFGNGNKFVGDWVDGERMGDHGAFTWANNPQRPRTYS